MIIETVLVNQNQYDDVRTDIDKSCKFKKTSSYFGMLNITSNQISEKASVYENIQNRKTEKMFLKSNYSKSKKTYNKSKSLSEYDMIQKSRKMNPTAKLIHSKTKVGE